jgi:hypothetical protein
LSKGLERTSLKRMSEVTTDAMPGHPVAVLTGPNLAKEILGGQPAASVVAIDDVTIANELQRIFSRPSLRVYTNDDVVGCEVAGVVKNVIAIAAGMAEGMGFGDNTRATLITRGLAEMTRLGVAMGGHPVTRAATWSRFAHPARPPWCSGSSPLRIAGTCPLRRPPFASAASKGPRSSRHACVCLTATPCNACGRCPTSAGSP